MINKYKNENAYFFGEELQGLGKTIVIKYNDAELSNSITNGTEIIIKAITIKNFFISASLNNTNQS